MSDEMTKLAIITTHPVQYYAPWFVHIVATTDITLKVFYLWDFGIVSKQEDPEFGAPVVWDIPLLDGYEFEWIPNVSRRPGTDHFWGLQNPGLLLKVQSFDPTAVLLIGYNFASMIKFILQWPHKRVPMIFRGDSHRLLAIRGFKVILRKVILYQVFRRFAAFLYVGQANRDYFKIYGVPDNKLFFSPHSIDNARFQSCEDDVRTSAARWKRNVGVPDNHRIILFVGKFVAKKRPVDLLKAFGLSGLTCTSLVFVGAGELESELRRKAVSIDNVHFVPFQNQKDMPTVYHACDLLVLPSYGPSETWGLVVNEAFACGTPAIVSDNVGCAMDLIIPSRTGLCFTAGRVDQLTACLKQALSDPGFGNWGRNAREHIEKYTYITTTKGLLRALTAPA